MKNFCFTLSIAFLIYPNRSFGSEAGMPQLDPEFWASQIFWLLLIFLSLYLIIWKIFLPKITYSIENRKSKIVNDISEAQKLKESAEIKLKEYNEIIKNSKIQARKMIDDNKKKLERDIESKKIKFDEEINKELEIVEREIIELKKTSKLSINKIATETTAEIIKQIMDTEVNNSNVSAIVEDIAKKQMDKHQ
jgi:F-type H+-transporting ATPase subunit b